VIRELHTLTITDFRSIKGTVHVPLNAPIILLHGMNGAGKTSVLVALELALTGDIAAMRREDPGFVRHLVHQGAERASIRISGPGLNADAGEGATAIENGEITQRAVLGPDQAQFFAERCYLAQSVLGRLLDIYSHADASTDSPLTRFVKDLLRLDELDALVDGLRDAGHLTRAKNLVRALRLADDLRQDFRNQRDATAKTFDALASDISQHRNELRRLVEDVPLEPPVDEAEYADFDGVRRRLAQDNEETPLVRLIQHRRELDSLSAGWEHLPTDADTAERRRLEAEVRIAVSDAQVWKDTTGAQLNRVIEDLREIFPELSSWQATDPLAGHAQGQKRATTEVARLEKALEQERSAATLAASLNAEVARATSRLTIIDEQIAGIGTSAGGLARALANVVPHIHGEDCPVCGRDFTETGHGSLRAHIQETIANLTEQAGRLSALTTERTQTQARLSDLTRRSASAAAARLNSGAVLELQARLARLVGLARELTELSDAVSEGSELIRRQSRAEGRLAELRDRERREGDLRAGVLTLAAELNQPKPASAEPFSEIVGRLRAIVQTDEAKLAAKRQTRMRALTVCDALAAIQAEARETMLVRDAAAASYENVDNAFREAERLRAQARRVGNTAREVRATIVRRVFNENLNTLWRDLFIRLAPTEPYVPAFRLPETAEGVVAQLETRTRSGERAGTPGTMLSAGNLNTAALTLFLALHLSVDPKFPWLVLDDPVQSMDEVHIAQFAALLRTISKNDGRKFIIAVHDRPLFEYLKLELSPAFDKDQLITVELRRSATEETIADTDFLPYEGEDVVAA
jgi:exonuclease SbcC